MHFNRQQEHELVDGHQQNDSAGSGQDTNEMGALKTHFPMPRPSTMVGLEGKITSKTRNVAAREHRECVALLLTLFFHHLVN
jgi:hypothetical protein